ncbi:MAG: ABC transporter [Phototrophicales bacterium]|nr:MAG: ABC transporter [Phototrophicales bacterium]
MHTEHLTKQYGDFVALSDLNLDVYRGEIFGYLGPNGAGKTTTIRTLLDLIRPTSGSATILGMDIRRDSVKIHARVGYMPSEMGLYNNMTARQYFRFLARARRISAMDEVERLAKRLDFDLDHSLEGLSTGNKRKVGLIAALMHKPELLILDEPTSGLDPLMQQTFNEMMLEAKSEGCTIFLSSHYLNEVQALCDRVGILRHGKLKAVNTVDELTHLNVRWVIITFDDTPPVESFKKLKNVSNIQVQGNELKFQVAGDMDELVKLAANYTVHAFRTQEPTLEEVFLQFYGNHEAPTTGHTEEVMA